jgi:hypothetical protein
MPGLVPGIHVRRLKSNHRGGSRSRFGNLTAWMAVTSTAMTADVIGPLYFPLLIPSPSKNEPVEGRGAQNTDCPSGETMD